MSSNPWAGSTGTSWMVSVRGPANGGLATGRSDSLTRSISRSLMMTVLLRVLHQRNADRRQSDAPDRGIERRAVGPNVIRKQATPDHLDAVDQRRPQNDGLILVR